MRDLVPGEQAREGPMDLRDDVLMAEASAGYGPIFAGPIAGQVNVVDTAPCDGWLSACMFNDADQATTMPIYVGRGMQPNTLAAASTALNLTSIYRLSAQSSATPLAANTNYVVGLDTSIVPANSAYVRRFDVAPGLKLFGAPSSPPAPSPGSPHTFTADTDGILQVLLSGCSDGGVSATVWTAGIIIGGQQIAACSAGWGDSSCITPVPKGSVCTVQIGVVQGDATWNVDLVWTPLVGAKLGAPQLNLSPNYTYTAQTDGFVVVVLAGDTGSYSEATCAISQGGTETFGLMVSAAGPYQGIILPIVCGPLNSMTLPVSHGQQINLVSDLYHPAAGFSATWIPMRR